MRELALWCLCLVVFMASFAFLLVPLYELFCQQATYGDPRSSRLYRGWEIVRAATRGALSRAPTDATPMLNVDFQAVAHLDWEFTPLQRSVSLRPGDTALAFFRVRSRLPRAAVGVSTYHLLPAAAAPHFVKIQCFCFDEQTLRAGEAVDMPVLFTVDPAWTRDPRLRGQTDLTLAYTFFEANTEIPAKYKKLINETRSQMDLPPLDFI